MEGFAFVYGIFVGLVLGVYIATPSKAERESWPPPTGDANES